MARLPEPEKRSELARAAVEVLQREGTDVSMAQLADALGIKRPTLLYHFPTKAHIVELALVELLGEQAVYVQERVSENAHPIDRLFAQMKAIHAFHRGREARIVFLTQAIAACAGERMTAILEAGNHVFEARRRASVELLREGMAEGTVAPCDPEALIAATRALTDGLMVQRVMSGLDLAPVHALVWEQLYLPLKIEPKRKRSRQPITVSSRRSRS